MSPADRDTTESGDGDAEAVASFGAWLRSQRKLAQLSLRQLAELSSLSNPYLSKIERGLQQPSIQSLTTIASALGLPTEAVLAKAAGLMPGLDGAGASGAVSTEQAIRQDPALNEDQKAALLSVYRSFVE